MNILIIKLGALGDFIQGLTFMKAIRKHHADAHITLLTTKGFAKFGEDCGYFDDIIIDHRAKWFQFSKWSKFKKDLQSRKFSKIYDLQNNHRTGLYHDLIFKSQNPEWIGKVKSLFKKSLYDENAPQHGFDRHKAALQTAGITDITMDALDWMQADLNGFDLKKPYVLLVPGCAPTRPEKRWPVEHYSALANHLVGLSIQPVIIGTQDEAEVTQAIADACSDALDLTGQTSLAQIAALARGSAGAIGNDTGPMHLIGVTGTPSLVLFGASSDPLKHAPRGDSVNVLQEANLQNLAIDTVIKTFQPWL